MVSRVSCFLLLVFSLLFCACSDDYSLYANQVYYETSQSQRCKGADEFTYFEHERPFKSTVFRQCVHDDQCEIGQKCAGENGYCTWDYGAHGSNTCFTSSDCPRGLWCASDRHCHKADYEIPCSDSTRFNRCERDTQCEIGQKCSLKTGFCAWDYGSYGSNLCYVSFDCPDNLSCYDDHHCHVFGYGM